MTSSERTISWPWLSVELHDELAQCAEPAVEAALYYTVADALTNVVRYAHASGATVSLYRADGWAVAEITDDGCGGADQRRGSALRGLTDRLGALHGVLELESPPGWGTSLRARTSELTDSIACTQGQPCPAVTTPNLQARVTSPWPTLSILA